MCVARLSDRDVELTSPSRRRRRRRRSGKGRGARTRLFGALTVLFILLGLAVGATLLGAAVGPTLIESRCDLSLLKPVNLGTNSFVAAQDNSLLGTIPAKKNRQQLTLAQISP